MDYLLAVLAVLTIFLTDNFLTADNMLQNTAFEGVHMFDGTPWLDVDSILQ